MSWAEVKKINENLGCSLDKLFTLFKDGYRKYIYENCVYRFPVSGVYTIRAYNYNLCSYAKFYGKFKENEKLNITISNASISITSDKKSEEEFSINLLKDTYINANSTNFTFAVGFGGKNGGNSYVNCNNGISLGGGGGYGMNGGSAYAKGINAKACGGGGGSAGSTSNIGIGGSAYINDVEIDDIWSGTSIFEFNSGKGTNGSSGYGQAGTGCLYGAGTYTRDGKTINAIEGESAKSANTNRSDCCKGYFAGGVAFETQNEVHRNSGNGGWYGGNGNRTGFSYYMSYFPTNAGDGLYGIGGTGGQGYYRTGSSVYDNDRAPAGRGGNGKYFGGNGGNVDGNSSLGTGGSGIIGGYPNGSTILPLGQILYSEYPQRRMDSIIIIEYGISDEDF